MTTALESIVKIPESVLSQQISGESVLLDMDSEQYFGLDEVGTRIWQLLTEHGRLAEVYAAMLAEFDVEPAVLERDLANLIAALADRGLVQIEAPPHQPATPGDVI
jgi:hypothetical protein